MQWGRPSCIAFDFIIYAWMFITLTKSSTESER